MNLSLLRLLLCLVFACASRSVVQASPPVSSDSCCAMMTMDSGSCPRCADRAAGTGKCCAQPVAALLLYFAAAQPFVHPEPSSGYAAAPGLFTMRSETPPVPPPKRSAFV